jgi:hypothetical protein
MARVKALPYVTLAGLFLRMNTKYDKDGVVW